MTILDTIRQYCKDNKISVRKLAAQSGITARQAQYFLQGNTPNGTAMIALQSWYNLQEIQNREKR